MTDSITSSFSFSNDSTSTHPSDHSIQPSPHSSLINSSSSIDPQPINDPFIPQDITDPSILDHSPSTHSLSTPESPDDSLHNLSTQDASNDSIRDLSPPTPFPFFISQDDNTSSPESSENPSSLDSENSTRTLHITHPSIIQRIFSHSQEEDDVDSEDPIMMSSEPLNLGSSDSDHDSPLLVRYASPIRHNSLSLSSTVPQTSPHLSSTTLDQCPNPSASSSTVPNTSPSSTSNLPDIVDVADQMLPSNPTDHISAHSSFPIDPIRSSDIPQDSSNDPPCSSPHSDSVVQSDNESALSDSSPEDFTSRSPILIEIPSEPSEREEDSNLIRSVFDLKSGAVGWPFRNFSASRFLRFPNPSTSHPSEATSDSETKDQSVSIVEVSVEPSSEMIEDEPLDDLPDLTAKRKKASASGTRSMREGDFEGVSSSEGSHLDIDRRRRGIKSHESIGSDFSVHGGGFLSSDDDSVDSDDNTSSDDDDLQDDDLDMSYGSDVTPTGSSKAKPCRRRVKRYRKVMRRARKAQAQQCDIYERSKRRAIQILVNLLDRTEPNGVLPTLHRFQAQTPASSPAFLGFGSSTPSVNQSGVVQLRQSDVDDIRKSLLKPSSSAEFVPINQDDCDGLCDSSGELTPRIHHPRDRKLNNSPKGRKMRDEMRREKNSKNATIVLDSDSDDEGAVLSPRLFLGRKQIELRDANNKDSNPKQLIGDETFFTVNELGRYLAVMMYIFGSEMIFEILAEVLTCPTIDFRSVSEDQALRRSYLVYEFIATCLGEGDCFFSTSCRPTSCFGTFYPQHDSGRAALNLMRNPMIRKSELGSWQLQPPNNESNTTTSSSSDGWFARATAVMNSAFHITRDGSDSDEDVEAEEDFCADDPTVDDGLLVRRHSSASSISSSFEGSQGGDGDPSTDLNSLHYSLRVLAQVIITEYALPSQILHQIKDSTTLEGKTRNCRSTSSISKQTILRNFHHLRHHNKYHYDQHMAKPKRSHCQGSSNDKFKEGVTTHHQQQRNARVRTAFKRLGSRGVYVPTTVRFLRRDYHSHHRLFIDRHNYFEFPPSIPANSSSRFNRGTFSQQHPLVPRLGSVNVGNVALHHRHQQQPTVRYNRELLSHKLPATLLRCLLAHKDLLVKTFVQGLRDISVRIDCSHGRKHSIHICRLLDMLFSLYEQEIFTTLLISIDGLACFTQAISLPGVSDFLLRLLSCSIPHAPVFVNPSLVHHFGQIQWSRILTEGLSPSGEDRRIEWLMIRLFNRWRSHFSCRMIHSLGLDTLYYDYSEQLFIQPADVKILDLFSLDPRVHHDHHHHKRRVHSSSIQPSPSARPPLHCFAHHINTVHRSVHDRSMELTLKFGISIGNKPQTTADLFPTLWDDQDLTDFDNFLVQTKGMAVPQAAVIPSPSGYGTVKVQIPSQPYSGVYFHPNELNRSPVMRIEPLSPNTTKDPYVYLVPHLISNLLRLSPKLLDESSNDSSPIEPSSPSFIPLLCQFAIWCVLSDQFTWTGLLLLLVLHHHVQTRTYPKHSSNNANNNEPTNRPSRILRLRSSSDSILFLKSKLPDNNSLPTLPSSSSIHHSTPHRSRSLSFVNDPLCNSSDEHHPFWQSVRTSRYLLSHTITPSLSSSCITNSPDPCLTNSFQSTAPSCEPSISSSRHSSISTNHSQQLIESPARSATPIQDASILSTDDPSSKSPEDHQQSESSPQTFDDTLPQSIDPQLRSLSQSSPTSTQREKWSSHSTAWRLGTIGHMARKTTAQMIEFVGRLALDEFLAIPQPVAVPSSASFNPVVLPHHQTLSTQLRPSTIQPNIVVTHTDESTSHIPDSILLNYVRVPHVPYPPVDFPQVVEFLMRLLEGSIKPQMLSTAPLILDMPPPTHPDMPLYEVSSMHDPWNDPALNESVVPRNVEENAKDANQLTELKPVLELLQVIFTRKGFFISLVYALDNERHKFHAAELLAAFVQQMYPRKPLWRFCVCFSPLLCQHLPRVCQALEVELKPTRNQNGEETIQVSSLTLSLLEIIKMIVELDPCRALCRLPVSTWKCLGHVFIQCRDSSILGARIYSIFHRVIEFAGSNLIAEAFIKTGVLDEILTAMYESKSQEPRHGNADVSPFNDAFGSVMSFALLLQNIFTSRIQTDDGDDEVSTDEVEAENEEESSTEDGQGSGTLLRSELSPTLTLEEVVKLGRRDLYGMADLPECAATSEKERRGVFCRDDVASDDDDDKREMEQVGKEKVKTKVNFHEEEIQNDLESEELSENEDRGKRMEGGNDAEEETTSPIKLENVDCHIEALTEDIVEKPFEKYEQGFQHDHDPHDGQTITCATTAPSSGVNSPSTEEDQDGHDGSGSDGEEEDWEQPDVSDEESILQRAKQRGHRMHKNSHQRKSNNEEAAVDGHLDRPSLSSTAEEVIKLIEDLGHHKNEEIDRGVEMVDDGGQRSDEDQEEEEEEDRFESILGATISKLVGRVLEVKKLREFAAENVQRENELDEPESDASQNSSSLYDNDDDSNNDNVDRADHHQTSSEELPQSPRTDDQDDEESSTHWQTVDEIRYKDLLLYLERSPVWPEVLSGLMRVKANRSQGNVTAMSPLEEMQRLRDSRKNAERLIQLERLQQQQSDGGQCMDGSNYSDQSSNSYGNQNTYQLYGDRSAMVQSDNNHVNNMVMATSDVTTDGGTSLRVEESINSNTATPVPDDISTVF